MASTQEWWDALLPTPAAERRQTEMLRLIAYDIAHPRRLQRIAKICERYGARVQYSFFECWLDHDRFQSLWSELCEAITEQEDRIVAYSLDRTAATNRMAAGNTMHLTERPKPSQII